MKKILLMCMGGFSTGMMVQKMETAARNKNEEVEIKAISINELENFVNDYDILVLAPQIAYQKATIAKKHPDKPLYMIQPADYGRLNGEKVLSEILEKLK